MEEVKPNERQEEKGNLERKSVRRLLVLLLIGAGLVTIGLVIGRTFLPRYTSTPGRSCDRLASADLSKLQVALERLGNELIGLGCDATEDWPIKSEDDLAYLVGSYYGWNGTSSRCDVRIRIVGKEIWACALKGSEVGNEPDIRWIYRIIPLQSGKDLHTIRDRCFGLSLGGRGKTCYKSSMLTKDSRTTGKNDQKIQRCVVREPVEKCRCEELVRK